MDTMPAMMNEIRRKNFVLLPMAPIFIEKMMVVKLNKIVDKRFRSC